MLRRMSVLVLLAVLRAVAAHAAEWVPNWPQFRGPGSAGVAEGQKPPVEFGPTKNVLWKVSVPPGHSSPVIWGDRIFLTAGEGGKLQTLCFSRSDGKLLWRAGVSVDRIEPMHRDNSPASATPCTDGQRVYAYFGSFGLVAYDMEGGEVWRKPLPAGYVLHGSGTSPILAEGRLILNRDQSRGGSFLLAVEPATGREMWRSPRPQYLSSHSTPVYWARDGAREIVVAGSLRIVGYDVETGAERWSCGGMELVSICPTPAIGEGMLYAMSQSLGGGARFGPAALGMMMKAMDVDRDGKVALADFPAGETRDFFTMFDADADGSLSMEEAGTAARLMGQSDHGLVALRSPGTGDVTASHIAWRYSKTVSNVASGLYYRGDVYFVRNGGFLTCLDGKTGKVVYDSQRVGAPGDYYASPVAADGRIYLCSRQGTVTAVASGEKPEVLARNELGDSINATPAIVESRIYVRTAQWLWAFGEPAGSN